MSYTLLLVMLETRSSRNETFFSTSFQGNESSKSKSRMNSLVDAASIQSLRSTVIGNSNCADCDAPSTFGFFFLSLLPMKGTPANVEFDLLFPAKFNNTPFPILQILIGPV